MIGASMAILKERKDLKDKRIKETYEKFMSSIQSTICTQDLLKQSKHFKTWRERRLLMTKTMIGTFEVKGGNLKATEWIRLITVQGCFIPPQESSDPKGRFVFGIYGEDKNENKIIFRFASSTKQKRDQWMQLIKKYSLNIKN